MLSLEELKECHYEWNSKRRMEKSARFGWRMLA